MTRYQNLQNVTKFYRLVRDLVVHDFEPGFSDFFAKVNQYFLTKALPEQSDQYYLEVRWRDLQACAAGNDNVHLCLQTFQEVVYEFYEDYTLESLQEDFQSAFRLLRASNIPTRQLCYLLGINRTTWNAWHHTPPAAVPERMSCVACCVFFLQRGWTSAGIFQWFERPRLELAGQTPRQCLDEQLFTSVVALARGGLAQTAT